MRFFRNRGDGTFEDRTAERRPGRRGGRPQHDPGRLRQRRLRRRRWCCAAAGWAPRDASRSRCCATTATAPSRTSPKAAGLLRISRRPRPRPGSTTTATAGSTSSWATRPRRAGSEEPSPCELFHNNRDGTFTNVAREVGRRRRRLRQGRRERRLRQRRPARPLRLGAGRRQPALPQRRPCDRRAAAWRFTNVAAAGRRHRADDTASAPSSSTTTTTAGPTSSSRATAASRPRPWRRTWPPTTWACPRRRRAGGSTDNKGDGTFEDVTQAAGLYKVIPAMGLNFGDLDNDGWLDLYLGTGNPDFGTLIPNRMFRNADGRAFQDVTTAGNFGHLQKGHADRLRRRRQRRRPGRLRGDGRRVPGGQGLQRALPQSRATATTGCVWSSRACAPTAARSARASRSSSRPGTERAISTGRSAAAAASARSPLRAGDRPRGRTAHHVGRGLLAGHGTEPTAHGLGARSGVPRPGGRDRRRSPEGAVVRARLAPRGFARTGAWHRRWSHRRMGGRVVGIVAGVMATAGLTAALAAQGRPRRTGSPTGTTRSARRGSATRRCSAPTPWGA